MKSPSLFLVACGLILHCIFQWSNAFGSIPKALSRLAEGTRIEHAIPTVFLWKDELRERIANENQSILIVEGYVTAKRTFGSSLMFADLTTMSPDGVCQTMLRREFYEGEADYYDGYRKCLRCLGSLVEVHGAATPTRNPGEAVLLVQSIKLVRVPHQAQHIDAILHLAQAKALPLDEVAHACGLEKETLANHLQSSNPKDLKKVAKEILESLPPLPDHLKERVLSGSWKEPSKKRSSQGSSNQQWRDLPVMPREWIKPTTISPSTELLESDVVSSPFTVEQIIQRETDLQGDGGNGGNDMQFFWALGWVQNRRRFQLNVTSIQLVDSLMTLGGDDDKSLDFSTNRLECVLEPSLCKNAHSYGNVLAAGAKVLLLGQLEHVPVLMNSDESSSARRKLMMWVHKVRLVQSSWRPTTVRYLLDQLYESKIDILEAADALNITQQQALKLSQCHDVTKRSWHASQLSTLLQSEMSRMATIETNGLQTLNHYEELRKAWPIHASSEDSLEPIENSRETGPEPQNFGSVVGSSPILGSGGVRQSLPGSKWERKKRPQIEWMTQEIVRIVKAHPDFGKRVLHILDIGGGKGDLANHLGQCFMTATTSNSCNNSSPVQVHVLDIASKAIANGAMRANRQMLHNVQFHVGDAQKATDFPYCVDMVVALHACGTLSDVALAHAVHHQAGIVICPCCFSSNRHLVIPTFTKQPQASGMNVEDFLNISPDDWSVLRRLAEVQGDVNLAGKSIHTICAIRAKAIQEKGDGLKTIEIKSFPIQYSTRNVCIVASRYPVD